MVAPLLTVDVSGNPYVEVFFDPEEFDAEVSYLRIVRLSEGREWLVRGGVDIATGVAALDFEVPFGVQSEYRAEMFSVVGASLGWTEASSVVVSYVGMIVHQPLDPTMWVRVWNLSGTAASLARPAPSEIVYTEGSVVGKRIGSRRRGLEGTTVQFMVATQSDADGFQQILGSYGHGQIPIVCIRGASTTRLPSTFFASGDWEEIDATYRYGRSEITFTAACTEVESPFPGLAVPLLTYDDLDAAYDTYDDRDAAYATYTDQDRDYSLAGLAG